MEAQAGAADLAPGVVGSLRDTRDWGFRVYGGN